MHPILAVTVPFFALVLCGYLAARRHVLPESAIPGLNAFVLYFALPCMLFRFGASTPLLELLNPAVMGVYLASALIMVFFTVTTSLSARVNLKNASFGALVAAFPNTGFMGVPLLVALLGPAAAGPVICSMLTDLFITSSLCIALAQAAHHGPGRGSPQQRTRHDGEDPSAAQQAAQDRQAAQQAAQDRQAAQQAAQDRQAAQQAAQDRQAAQQAALRALRGALSNPLPWSIAVGAVFARTSLELPVPVKAIVDMLANAATPVALFTIGAVLWRAGQHVSGRTPLADYLPVALIKNLLHPLLVLLLALAARSLGAPLSLFQITVLTLAAALPSASNVSLLAERFGADNGRIARIIMTSTVLAFASFSALAWLFGVKPA